MTGLVDEVRALDIVYPDYSRAFDTVSYNILTEKLMRYGLDEQMVGWAESCLNSQAQRVVVSDAKSHCDSVTGGIPVGSLYRVQSCSASSFMI